MWAKDILIDFAFDRKVLVSPVVRGPGRKPAEEDAAHQTLCVCFGPIVLKKSPKTGKEPIRFEIVTKKSNKNKAKNISVYG
jgi:hypothetical protein